MSRWMKKASAWLLALVIMAAYMPAQQVQAEGTGWVERDGCTYYLDEEGRRVYGWYRVDGIPYYFNENGALASIWGIDVSEFQGTIDWNKVKNAGCQFAILRLGFRSYGASGYMYEDECFDAYIRGAQAVGIPVGIYFYSQAITPEEAVAEAEYVLQTLSKYPAVEFPIAIDIEDTAVSGRVTKANLTQRQYTDIVLAFCDRIQQAGYDAMVYSYYSILEHRIYDEEMAPNNIDIWYADYHAYPNTYGGDFTVWQYSATEGISGISGNVDKNVATVDYAGRYQDLATRGSLEPLPGEVVDGNATSRPEMEMLNYPTVRRGDSGEYVTILQQWLNYVGYNCGYADGIFGGNTYNAVTWFQKDHWLSVDGIVGQMTWSELYDLVRHVSENPGNPVSPEESLPEPEPEESQPEESQPEESQPEESQPEESQPEESQPEQEPEPEPEPEPAPEPVDVSGYPMVRYGSSGSYVTTLQNWLNELGYNCGYADGIFGGNTYNAVLKFQRDQGLSADGIVGPMSWKALAAEMAGVSTPEPEPTPTPDPEPEPEPTPTPEPETPSVDVSGYPLIEIWDSGEYVRKLQNRLNELGYNCGYADGIFGNNTNNAVRKFQKDRGLSVDGMVGQMTWKALFS